MLDEKDISKLLRLKRHEQPPPGYFDDFLREFQARQRQELLRQPAWRIALERLGAFFSDHATGRLAYGGATLAVLAVAGFTTVQTFRAPAGSDRPALASAGFSNLPVQPAPLSVRAYEGSAGHLVSQTGRVPIDGRYEQATQLGGPRTHYVIDSRPVSYERPSF